MKKIIFLLIILNFSCTSKSILEVLNKSEFSDVEKQDILKLTEFFESKILIEGKGIDESYKQFLIEISNNYESIGKKISIEEQRNLTNTLDKSTLNELWYEPTTRAFVSFSGNKLKEPIKYKSLAGRIDGKYSNLLQNLSGKNPKINTYLGEMKNLGDFPMFYSLFGLLVDTKPSFIENLNEGHWRLIIAIHILTINENQERYKTATELN